MAVAYAITAWLLAQVASLAATTFEAPSWVMKMILIGLIIGFPIALVLAWAYEMTPKGIIKTEVLDASVNNDLERPISKPLINNVIIGFLLIIVVGQFFYNWSKNDKPPTTESAINHQTLSIAVLPLINLNSKDENVEYFSDGVTQEIIDELAKVDAFSLTAFTTTLLYKNNSKPFEEIGKELDVNYIVAGTSRIYNISEEGRVILSIELVDAKTKKRLWNARYEEVLQNAPKIQLDIAKDIANNLQVNLSTEEEQSLNNPNTISGEAFQLFLKAKQHMSGMTIEAFDTAEDLLLQAIQLDPNYTQAYTLLAWNYVLQGWSWYWRDQISIDEGRQRAKDYIDKALLLDKNSSDIHLVKANFDHTFNARIGEAIEDVETALRLNSWPEIPTNYCICTAVTTYVLAGNLKRAKELASLASRIDPGNLFLFHDQGIIYMQEGKMVEARAMFQKALDIMDIPIFNFLVGWSLYHNKNYESSIAYFEQSRLNDTLEVGVHLAYLSNAHYKLGQSEKSNTYRSQLMDRVKNGDKSLNMAMAIIAGEQGTKEETLSHLEKAYSIKEPMMTYLLSLDPLFKPLKTDPRYMSIWNEIMEN